MPQMVAEPEEDAARMDTMGDAIDSRTAPSDVPDPIVVSFTFRRSTSFAALADAMSKAQGEITGASKDSLNPHFKSKYADLAAVWDACRAPLSKNGIAVFQPPMTNGALVTVTTLLAHRSGEWIESDLTMQAQQNNPQGIGSTITYARRYALSAMVGVAPEDDDGNAASQGNGQANGYSSRVELPPSRTAPTGYEPWWDDMQSVADEGWQALSAAFNSAKPEHRRFLTGSNNAAWEALKARAQKVKASA